MLLYLKYIFQILRALGNTFSAYRSAFINEKAVWSAPRVNPKVRTSVTHLLHLLTVLRRY
jgi:hypothetical protein